MKMLTKWGFCASCELWRLETWGDPHVCPKCGETPDPVEVLVDSVAHVVGHTTLVLELPPGAEFPLLD